MFDFTKSYGVIFGHPWARYEQGGTLYDGAGKSYAEQGDRAELAEESYSDPVAAVENAREFLQRMLTEGPMNRNELFKEAENLGLPWDNVKNAAAEMKLNCYKIRENTFWRLPIE
jgi:hypothetical protein